MPERLSLQQFHRDEGSPISLVNLVDGAYVRVVQRRRGFSLPLEAAESLSVMGKIIGKEFQGHATAEFQILGLINHSHSTSADLA